MKTLCIYRFNIFELEKFVEKDITAMLATHYQYGVRVRHELNFTTRHPPTCLPVHPSIYTCTHRWDEGMIRGEWNGIIHNHFFRWRFK